MPLAVKYMEALSGNTESLQILDIAGGTGIPSITIAKEHPEIFVNGDGLGARDGGHGTGDGTGAGCIKRQVLPHNGNLHVIQGGFK